MRGCDAQRTRAGAVMALGALAGFLLTSPWAQGQVVNGNQLPNPRLMTLNPTGGKVGTIFEVTFTGSDLDGPEKLIFSHPGIRGVPVVPEPPKFDEKDPKNKGKTPPPPPPITKFSVSIGKEVPVGFYDVRFVNQHGVSNPRTFVVGDLIEEAEKEPNNDIEQAQRVEIGSTINGAINAPTDVDYTVFAGKKGQRVVIACLCNSIDSRLYPEMKLFDPRGRPMVYQRPLPGQDSVLDETLPEDGDYMLRLSQFTYTVGNAEYFYRLNISSAPWIEAVFPPMIEPGKDAQVTLFGRNLPGGRPDPTALMDGRPLDKLTLTISPPRDPQALHTLQFLGTLNPLAGILDGFEYRLNSPNGVSNPMLLTYALAPVVLENDKNDTLETAQEVTLPCEIAGRIDKVRDRDWFAFNAKKGDVFIIDVFSHSLGAPTDMYISLRNPKNQEIVLLDDNPNVVSPKGFYTASKDPPPYRFVVPEDGKYHLLAGSQVGDLLAGPHHVYRIRITPEKPDFRLVAMPPDDFRPDTCRLSQNGCQDFLVFAIRQDGFKNDITLTMEGLPPGVTCPPQVINGSQKQGRLVLRAADNAPPFTGDVKIVGTAVVNGQKVIREARPATITWPVQPNQNIPTLTRMDRSLVLAVRDKALYRLSASPDKYMVSVGDKLNIPLKLERFSPEFKAAFQLQPVAGDLPPGFTFGNLTFAPGKDDQAVALVVPANTNPGSYTLVFRGFAPGNPNPKAKPVNVVLPSAPVYLNVLPKQVANLSVDNANPSAKLGAEAVILVKVARLYDFTDSFKVQLVLPPNGKGIAADEIAIPAGQNEAKLTIRVPANFAIGNLQNLTIRAVAVLPGGVTLNHETKINLNVVK